LGRAQDLPERRVRLLDESGLGELADIGRQERNACHVLPGHGNLRHHGGVAEGAEVVETVRIPLARRQRKSGSLNQLQRPYDRSLLAHRGRGTP